MENEKQTLNELEKQLSRLGTIITAQDFENDIYKLFLRKEYSNITDTEKLRTILSFAENSIIEWHRENYENQELESIDFEKWKYKLINNFGEKITLLEFLKEKQKGNESFVNYFKRMEKIGKRLKQKEAFILDVIRLNLRKNGFHIKNLIAGERKLTENI